MNLKPKALRWLIKLIIRGAQRISPKLSLINFIALKLTSKANLLKAFNFWEVPKAFAPGRIPPSFLTYFFGFGGLTGPIANFFSSVKPGFATAFSKANTTEAVPVTQPAKKIRNKFNQMESAMARPGQGFSLARFFAASPENAKKVVLLAQALHNLEASAEKGKITTNTNSHRRVKTKLPIQVSLRNELMVVKMVANWPRESPELWRSISAPVGMTVKVSEPEWQTPRKMSKSVKGKFTSEVVARTKEDVPDFDISNVRGATARFITFENPFKALEEISDDDFQVPHRKRNTKTATRVSTENRTYTLIALPVEVPAPVSVSPSIITTTPVLAPVPSTMITPPLTPVLSQTNPNITVNDSALAQLRRRQGRKNPPTTSPSPVLRKPIALMPLRETPDAWRQTSSPPRSPSPIGSNSSKLVNGWQQVQKRRRRNTRIREMGAPLDCNLDPTLSPNLAPESAINVPDRRHTDTIVKRIAPSIVILHKTKRITTSV